MVLECCGSVTRILAMFLSLTCMLFAQEVGVPSWVKPESQGGPPSSLRYVPPEYNGQHSAVVSMQLVPGGRGVVGENAHFTFSPLSGVLFLRDKTGPALRVAGWQTGFDRIYAMTLLPRMPGSTSDRFVAVAWDDTSNTCVLVNLVVTANGVVQQSLYGFSSAVNKIWSTCDFIGGKMYTYELQSHVVERYFDTNNDGRVDTLDVGFQVPLPMFDVTVPPNSEANRRAMEVHPIRRIVEAPPVGFRLVGNPARRSSRDRYLKETGPGLFSYYTVGQDETVQYLSISCLVTTGQKRLFVRGTPGLHFRAWAVPGSGSRKAISSVATIPASGQMILETKAVSSAWAAVFLLSCGEDVSSSQRTVRPLSEAIIFRTGDRDYLQGARVTFEGDKFPPNVVYAQMRWPGGGTARVKVENLTPNRFEVRLPMFGAGTSTIRRHRTRVDLWLEDSGGNILSVLTSFGVSHD